MSTLIAQNLKKTAFSSYIMIIALTGTPGTGKTAIAKALSKAIEIDAVSLNDLAEKKNLYSGFDKERDCKVVDLKAIGLEIEKYSSVGKNLIIESHYSQEYPSDILFLLRANPSELIARGKEKGWHGKKTDENIQAEIMEEVKNDSRKLKRNIIEVDTTKKTVMESVGFIVGELEKEGLFINNDLTIPEKVRETLRIPYGTLFKDFKGAVNSVKCSTYYTVGDYVTHGFSESGETPQIAVIDGVVGRKPFMNEIKLGCFTFKLKNPVGYLSKALWMAVNEALKKKANVKIAVSGEEDMAVLPLMILAPLNTSIVYGLHGHGTCVIRIDKPVKKIAKEILGKIVSLQ